MSRALSGLPSDEKANKDSEVDTGGVANEYTDEVDSEAIDRLMDSEVDERANAIEHVANEAGDQ